jgi:hypothetical protein
MGTTIHGLPYPEPTDPVAAGAAAIRSLAESIDTAVMAHKVQYGNSIILSDAGGVAWLNWPEAFSVTPVAIVQVGDAAILARHLLPHIITNTYGSWKVYDGTWGLMPNMNIRILYHAIANR